MQAHCNPNMSEEQLLRVNAEAGDKYLIKYMEKLKREIEASTNCSPLFKKQ